MVKKALIVIILVLIIAIAFYFIILDNQPKETNTANASCTENWTCTDWSECADGQQTRTCIDANNCGTTIDKPATNQTCTMPAPGTIDFAGYTWDVKTSNGVLDDPGPNIWDNSTDSVWVDNQGRLHMKIRKVGDVWYSSEIHMQKSLGYGKYIFTTESNVSNYDKNIVAAMFLYSFANEDIEDDLEYTKWGGDGENNGWFSVWYFPDQSVTSESQDSFFISTANDSRLTNLIDWNPNRIIFQINDSTSVKRQWTCTESDIIPKTTDGLVAIINFWLYNPAPSNGQDAEFIVSNFTFIPDGA